MANLVFLQCPHCRYAMQQTQNLVGRIVTCPSCEKKFQMSGATASFPASQHPSQPRLVVRPVSSVSRAYQQGQSRKRASLAARGLIAILLIVVGVFAVKMKDSWSLPPLAYDTNNMVLWKASPAGSADKSKTGVVSADSAPFEPMKESSGKATQKGEVNNEKVSDVNPTATKLQNKSLLQKQTGPQNVPFSGNPAKVVRDYLQTYQRKARIIREYAPESSIGSEFLAIGGPLESLHGSWIPVYDLQQATCDPFEQLMATSDLNQEVVVESVVRVEYEIDQGFGRKSYEDCVFLVTNTNCIYGKIPTPFVRIVNHADAYRKLSNIFGTYEGYQNFVAPKNPLKQQQGVEPNFAPPKVGKP